MTSHSKGTLYEALRYLEDKVAGLELQLQEARSTGPMTTGQIDAHCKYLSTAIELVRKERGPSYVGKTGYLESILYSAMTAAAGVNSDDV